MVTFDEILNTAYPYLLLFLVILVCGILLLIAWYYFFILKNRRKWNIEVHEPKADGKLHTVGRDVLYEKRKKGGSLCYYWLKKAKREAIPPPAEVVDRWGKHEEVDYIRIERDFVPAKKTTKFDYTDPEIKKKIIPVYDAIIKKIHSIKTTMFNAEAVENRFIYIPLHRTLCAKIEYSPIPYDMNMMAVNEITNADSHFASKYEWWKKYGAVIIFGATVVFLLIMAVLTYGHLEEMAVAFSGKMDASANILQGIADKMGGAVKPPA